MAPGRVGAAAAEHPKPQGRTDSATSSCLAWRAAQGGVMESMIYDNLSLGEVKALIFQCDLPDITGSFMR
jgi:hypothetical protein